MKAKTVTYIFIFFIAYLPLQYTVVGIVGFYKSEPWPAFVFPGFKSVHVYDNGYQAEQNHFEVYIYSKKEPKILLPHHFFPEVPLSQLPALMRNHFRGEELESRYFSDDAVRWLEEHAQQSVGQEVDRLDIIEVRKYFSSTKSSTPDSVKQIHSRTFRFN